MTKYILHGGNTHEANPDNDSFFQEMVRGLDGKVKILLNYFSRDENEYDQCFSEDKERILKNSEKKDLEFEIAQPSNLTQQIQNADVMYMRGGNTARLTEKLRAIIDIEKLFSNKAIAGSSAGTYVLTKYYWENNNNHLGEGLGILNLKAFCHYTPDDLSKIEQLSKYKETLSIITLPNYKWLVIYK